MMRYQRVSPDVVPLTNGRKPNNHLRTICKEDDFRVRSGSGSANPVQTHQETTNTISISSSTSHFPPTSDPLPSEVQHQNQSRNQQQACSNGNGNGRDVLLQWGHRKRSRGSRAESRTAGDEFTSSPAGSSRQSVKVQRRAAIAGAEKIAAAAAAAAMPPPPCGGGVGYTRGANLRPCMPLRDFSAANRTVEERSGGQSRPDKHRSPEKAPNNKAAAAAAVVHNGFGPSASAMNDQHRHSDPKTSSASDHHHHHDAGSSKEKTGAERLEWPRIYVSLSRKEKEDDFLAMKGTKLPQRPKKRAKNIDKSLQYCFPGMWLSDLTRGRYEVREKKCVKKKPRGLKGMESVDSDSE
ncbi:putative protein TPRXL isoform X2 [Iris pallida]|uniref:Uncharacterized protein n=1 Tax=Iris pallida TaxID=29817 RepID=A0AAX6IF16_IRIPA|nr:putative protein TPRXL isoform X2 [Iris pallida]